MCVARDSPLVFVSWYVCLVLVRACFPLLCSSSSFCPFVDFACVPPSLCLLSSFCCWCLLLLLVCCMFVVFVDVVCCLSVVFVVVVVAVVF